MGLRRKKTLLEQAEGHVGTAIDQANKFVQDTALPALSDAREKAAPVVAAGAATLAERAAEARDKAAPVMAAGAATLAERAAEAHAFAEEKAAELNDTKPKKRSKIKMLLLLGAIGGAIAVVAKKLQGSSDDNGGWQTSYDPAPPPSPASSAPPPVETAPDADADPLTDPLPDSKK